MNPELPVLLEGYFTRRLMNQRKVSTHTLASYRDTFRLLLKFAAGRVRKRPADLLLADLAAPTIMEFLDSLEAQRRCAISSRNQRLAAIRSFFHYVAVEAPQQAGLIQRVLAIPGKRTVRRLIGFLEREEITALLSGVDRRGWLGRRDHALLLTMVQTGLRMSEITDLRLSDVELGTGAHVRCLGKGRKERCTPLAKPTVAVLRAWVREREVKATEFLFPSRGGGRLSADAVQRLLAKHVTRAQTRCATLRAKHITPHVLRHTAAMELLLAGVDRALIAIWLGHESIETTQVYLDASLALKERILEKVTPVNARPMVYHPDDTLLAFLQAL